MYCVAMCCRSESQIRITSSCPGAAVDILTLTLSHVGLGELWKVLMAVLKVQELCSIIFISNGLKVETLTAAKMSVLLKMNEIHSGCIMIDADGK